MDQNAAKVYGRASNPDRITRSLPEIPETWRQDGRYTFVSWNNPARADPATTDKPMRFSKEVRVDQTGTVLEEADYYQSGKKYRHLDPDSSSDTKEELRVGYDFEAARQGKNPWSCSINIGPREGSNSQPDMKLIDEMLKAWGLDRLK